MTTVPTAEHPRPAPLPVEQLLAAEEIGLVHMSATLTKAKPET